MLLACVQTDVTFADIPANLERVRHWTHSHVLGGSHRPAVRVVGARFGSQAAAIGAALLAADLGD